MLLLCGDIQQNPGPTISCNYCNESITTASITCDQCNETYHAKCNKRINRNLNSRKHNDKCYSWICPNPKCHPNFNQPNNIFEGMYQKTNNRFSNLAKRNKATKCKPTKHKPKSQLSRKNMENSKTNNNNKLWNELTLISSKDYIGRELCYKCCKEIKPEAPAGTCSICERKAHIKCQKISPKAFKENEDLQNHRRICQLCSTDEKLIENIIDITNLKSHERPEIIDNIRSGKNELLIIHINARSVINKAEDIQMICYQNKPDILCITETWLNESVPLNAITPIGYKVLRQDRSDKFKQIYGRNRGGGVLVFHKEEINIERKQLIKNDYEENMWIHVKTKTSFLLGIIYRADYTDILKDIENESKMEKYLQKAYLQNKNVILMGDFNADDNKENICHKGKKMHEICDTYGLKQIINKPTRIDNNTRKSTIIDHIWLNPQENNIKSGTATGLSDHLATYIKLYNQKPKPTQNIITIRDFKNYNADAFNNDLREKFNCSNLQKTIETKDVNKAMTEFLTIIQEITETHAPMKEIKTKVKEQKIPWFTPELVKKIKIKNKILQDWHTYGLKEDKKALKKIKNEINHTKARLKKEYYSNEIQQHEGNSKKTWKILNQALGRVKDKNPIEPTNITQSKANQFNSFFATVGLEIQKTLKIQEHRTNFSNLKGFNFQHETTENVVKLINNIRKDVAVGYDNINSQLIKDSKEVIAPWLTSIINIAYDTNTFPDNMKIANIKPIFKEGDKEKIANYRPISILPILSKVYERSCTDQLVKYLEIKDLISKSQHAYRKGHSTQTCLVEIINELHENLDRGYFTGLAKLDLSKAYDSISHSLLLHKLAQMGLSENSIEYIKSYLNNRKQKTKFKNCISDIELVQSGIPQGSILGPILFVCFTNDLAKEFEEECKIVSYADDTILIVKDKNQNNLKARLENVIKLAQNWYTKNSMKNNIDKTEILVMSKGKETPKIEIEFEDDNKHIKIKPEESLKILGIYVDKNLNWNEQIRHTKKRAMNAIINLSRAKHMLTEKTKIILYNTLVTPHFTYGDIIWGGCSQENARKLQVAQNFAMRTIKNKRKRESAKEILHEMKYLNLAEKRQVHEAVFITKSLLNKTAQNITNKYLLYLSEADTRQAQKGRLKIPEHRTTAFKKSPLYRTIKTWNEIPTTINTNDATKFKKAYQNYLIEQRR